MTESVGVLVVLVAFGVKRNTRSEATIPGIVDAVPEYASALLTTPESNAMLFNSSAEILPANSAATGPDATITKLLAVPVLNCIKTGWPRSNSPPVNVPLFCFCIARVTLFPFVSVTVTLTAAVFRIGERK